MSCSGCSPFDSLFVDKSRYVFEETQKFVSVWKSEESTTVTTKQKVGEKRLKKVENNQADALAGQRQRFHLEQEKSHVVDEEDT